MHLLTLSKRVDLGPAGIISPGDYLVEDLNGAQLMTFAGGGMMRPVSGPSSPVGQSDTLFIRAGGFGDLILLTPVLREHKRRYPNARIAVATMPHYAQVFDALPYVDEVIQYPIPLDVANRFSRWVVYENAIENNPRAEVVHMTELFGEIAGMDAPAYQGMDATALKPDYRVRITEGLAMDQKYPRTAKPRVCVQAKASASGQCRVYPAPLMGAVVTKLLDKGWEVFMMGAKGEFRLGGNPRDGLRNLCPDDLSFRESAAVVNGADAFVGNDSSLLHVAGALDIPAVGLFAPFPWKLRTAYSPSITAIQGNRGCECCYFHANPVRGEHFPEHCPSKAKGYCQELALIEPARIVALVEKVARKRK